MKRLIYAIIAFILLLSLTLYSHISVNRHCNTTLNELKQFQEQTITSDTLTQSWSARKEKMSAFVNHDFLDQISLYIGQITLENSDKDEFFSIAYKNIEVLLSMVRDEQQLAAHSFY